MIVAYAAQSLLYIRLEEGAAGLSRTAAADPAAFAMSSTLTGISFTCLRAFRDANVQDTVLELGGGLFPLHAYRQGTARENAP